MGGKWASIPLENSDAWIHYLTVSNKWLDHYFLFKTITDTAQPIGQSWGLHRKGRCLISLYCFSRNVETSRDISVSFSSIKGEKPHQNFLRGEKVAPDSEPPSLKDVDLLYNFLDRRFIGMPSMASQIFLINKYSLAIINR